MAVPFELEDVLGRDVDVAVGAGRLDQAELRDVARDGRLGHGEALFGEGVDELALAADRTGHDQFADRPLAKALEILRGGHLVPCLAHQAAPTPAGREAVIRVPNVPSDNARVRAFGADASAMIASAPSQPSAPSAARTLGTIPPAMTPDAMRCSGLGDGQRVEAPAVGVADAVDIGHQDELAGTQTGRDARGHVVGVDVADDAVRVAGERRHDRHLAADEDRVEQVAAQADDARDEPELRDALGDEQAAIDARQADGIDAEVAQAGDELAVDHAPEDRGGHLEGRGIGDPQAAFEARRDAQALEPLGDPLAAAMDQDHGTSSRDRGHFREHLALVGDGRARPA